MQACAVRALPSHINANALPGWGGRCTYKDPGDDLLLHGLSHTTIGAPAFHCRVRDGIGWCHRAMVARERVEGRDGRLGWIPTACALTLSWGLGRNESWTGSTRVVENSAFL